MRPGVRVTTTLVTSAGCFQVNVTSSLTGAISTFCKRGTVESYLSAKDPGVLFPALSTQEPASVVLAVSGPEYVVEPVQEAMPDVASVPANATATGLVYQPPLVGGRAAERGDCRRRRVVFQWVGRSVADVAGFVATCAGDGSAARVRSAVRSGGARCDARGCVGAAERKRHRLVEPTVRIGRSAWRRAGDARGVSVDVELKMNGYVAALRPWRCSRRRVAVRSRT